MKKNNYSSYLILCFLFLPWPYLAFGQAEKISQMVSHKLFQNENPTKKILKNNYMHDSYPPGLLPPIKPKTVEKSHHWRMAKLKLHEERLLNPQFSCMAGPFVDGENNFCNVGKDSTRALFSSYAGTKMIEALEGARASRALNKQSGFEKFFPLLPETLASKKINLISSAFDNFSIAYCSIQEFIEIQQLINSPHSLIKPALAISKSAKNVLTIFQHIDSYYIAHHLQPVGKMAKIKAWWSGAVVATQYTSRIGIMIRLVNKMNSILGTAILLYDTYDYFKNLSLKDDLWKTRLRSTRSAILNL